MESAKPAGPLRRGWTTGACATAAAKAAYLGWRTGEFPDPVEIALPGGVRPAFALAVQEPGPDGARAGVLKDAGDDPRRPAADRPRSGAARRVAGDRARRPGHHYRVGHRPPAGRADTRARP